MGARVTRRVQRRRTKGWRMPGNTVCVTRPTKWGNPFVGPGAVLAHSQWLRSGWRTIIGVVGRDDLEVECTWMDCPGAVVLLEAIQELRGKNLACYCSLDKPCHADTLLKLARLSDRSLKRIIKAVEANEPPQP